MSGCCELSRGFKYNTNEFLHYLLAPSSLSIAMK